MDYDFKLKTHFGLHNNLMTVYCNMGIIDRNQQGQRPFIFIQVEGTVKEFYNS